MNRQTTLDFDEEASNDNRRRRQRRQAASKALLVSSSANNSDDENMRRALKESENMRKALKESVKMTNGNNLEEKRDDLIAKAAAKAERKRKRKEEKARRKAEKKAAKKQKLLAETNGKEDSEVEIIEEDENGVCTVSIQPKPIKLTIKTNGHSQPAPKSTKDIRTSCDKCTEAGNNANLVRCDECRRCFHFGCLIPPVTKSPKRPGWGWHCNECDPSDRDSDWHLD